MYYTQKQCSTVYTQNQMYVCNVLMEWRVVEGGGGGEGVGLGWGDEGGECTVQ